MNEKAPSPTTPTQTQTPIAKQTTIKIIDVAGREVEVPKKVDRIVAVGPGALKLIVYMNATDKVVGIEDCEKKWKGGRPYSLAHPELQQLSSIGSGGPKGIETAADPEKIIKLHPDVIFTTYGSWGNLQTVEKFQQKVGAPVVIITMGELKTFEDEELFKSLKIIGKILGKEERAEKVIEFIKSCVNDLDNRTKDIPNEKKLTAYVGGIGYRGAHGIFSTDSSYPHLQTIHAKNVAKQSGKEGHLFIDKETLIKWNPDVIFIDEGGLKLVE